MCVGGVNTLLAFTVTSGMIFYFLFQMASDTGVLREALFDPRRVLDDALQV